MAAWSGCGVAGTRRNASPGIGLSQNGYARAFFPCDAVLDVPVFGVHAETTEWHCDSSAICL